MRNSSGPLVIIGGAEDKLSERQILRRFVEMAGGDNARIVVIAAASEVPEEISRLYKNVFREINVNDIITLSISSRNQANSNATIAAIENATGVFFTGGNQLRITRVLGGTKADIAIHHKNEEGMPLAGTSAGAAMMSSIMITGGSANAP